MSKEKTQWPPRLFAYLTFGKDWWATEERNFHPGMLDVPEELRVTYVPESLCESREKAAEERGEGGARGYKITNVQLRAEITELLRAIEYGPPSAINEAMESCKILLKYIYDKEKARIGDKQSPSVQAEGDV